MSAYFFDTSALVKVYHPELGTPAVVQLFLYPASTCFISTLTLVEMQSAFAAKFRTGVLSQAKFNLARRKFGADLGARKVIPRSLFRRHYLVAENLIAKALANPKFTNA